MRSRKRNSNSFFPDNFKDEITFTSPLKKQNNLQTNNSNSNSNNLFTSSSYNSRDGPSMGNYDPKYPESITAFADGLRSDVMEIIGTGAGILNKSINFIFPFIGYDTVETNENDSLHDIEVTNNNNNNNSKSNKQKESNYKMKQSQEALKMRCQSLWGKDSNSNTNNMNMNNETSHGMSQSCAQKGGKVLLDKLNKNPSIQSFTCGDNDDHLVILGNVRMIVAKKNFDQLNSASILWSQPFREIGNCTINCSVGGSSGCSRLDITNRHNEIYTIYLRDPTLCVQVMMLIQTRCSSLAEQSSKNSSNSSNTSNTLSNNNMLNQPLSPLLIGSSPVATRVRGSKNLQKGRRKSKIDSNSPIINDENCLNGTESKSKNYDRQHSRLSTSSAMSLSPRTPLRETNEGSPFKRSRRQSTEGMEVVDLLGLSDMQSTPSTTNTTNKPFDFNLTHSTHDLTTMAIVSKSALLKTYLHFYHNGETIESVISKMKLDGVDNHTIEEFEKQCQTLQQEKELKEQNEPVDPLSKYKKMIKSGIPAQAVRHKMKLEGISQADQDLVVGIDTSKPLNQTIIQASTLPTAPVLPPPPPVLPPHLRKYQVMLKSGVPEGAVHHKMVQEGICPKDRSLVVGVKDEVKKETSSNVKQSNENIPSGPKFVGLHWEPIASTNEVLIQNSIWGEIITQSESSSLELAHDEYSKLSCLFAKKENKLLDSNNNSNNSSNNNNNNNDNNNNDDINNNDTTNNEDTRVERKPMKRKNSMPTTIDMSRSTNISIGLSSFKQKKMSIEMIIDCLNRFDVTTLGQEDLLRLQEILPTDNEVKTLQNFAASEEELHETELWLKKLTAIQGVTSRVKAMTFMVTAESSILCVEENLNLMSELSGKILSSSGLKDVLKCVLAIGNSMNQGTWKGGAKAIKLASLTRLSQTKSIDGKFTVMDYLVQVLNSRSLNGDVNSTSGLNIDDELKNIHIVKNISLNEITKEVEKFRSSLVVLSKEISQSVNLQTESETVKLNEFITFIDTKITFLEQLLNDINAKSNEILTYFSEEPETPLNQIFHLLASRKKFVDENSLTTEGEGNNNNNNNNNNLIELRSSSYNYNNYKFFERSLTGYTGLINQGATCYLNSLIQSLFMIPEFKLSLYSSRFDENNNNNNDNNNIKDNDDIYNLPKQLQRLFIELQLTSKGSISTNLLTKSFGWTSRDSFIQQDVQECMTVIFEHITNTYPDSEIALFLRNEWSGELQSGLTCQNCHHTRWRNETFRDLQLQVRGMSSIYESLENYFLEEIMEGVECSRCDGKFQHIKKGKFTKLPYILSLQLRRFDMNWQTFQRIKVNDPIQIASKLTLNVSSKSPIDGEIESNESNQNQLIEKEYELVSILVHSGSAHAGHYFCYVKDLTISSTSILNSNSTETNNNNDNNNNKWLLFNDSTVTKIDEEQLKIILGSNNPTETSSSSSSSSLKNETKSQDKSTTQPVIPSANNAYMLIYREISPINVSDLSSSLTMIPIDILEEVQNENTIYLQQKEKHDYERSFLHLSISQTIFGDSNNKINDKQNQNDKQSNSKFKVFRIHESSTLADLTTMVYNDFYPIDQRNDLITPQRENVRLRAYDSIKGTLLSPLVLFSKELLEKYHLQIPTNDTPIIIDESTLPTQLEMESSTILASLNDTTLKRLLYLEVNPLNSNFSIIGSGQGLLISLELCLYTPSQSQEQSILTSSSLSLSLPLSAETKTETENTNNVFSQPYSIEVRSNLTLNQFIDKISDTLTSIPRVDHELLVSNIVIVKHDITTGIARSIYPSTNSNINLTTSLSSFLTNGDRLYIDYDPTFQLHNNNNQKETSSTLNRLGLLNYFEGLYNQITIQYTDLRKVSNNFESNESSSPKQIERLEIKVDRRLPLRNLKEMISLSLNIPIEKFILLRGVDNDLDPQLEIKNINRSITENGLQDGSYLRLSYGIPLNQGEYRINLLNKIFLGIENQPINTITTIDYYKYEHIGSTVFQSNQTIKSIKELIKTLYFNNNQTLKLRLQMTQVNEVDNNNSNNNNNNNLQIKEKEYKTTFILSDNKTLLECLGNQLKDGIYLSITINVAEEEYDNLNNILISFYEWNNSQNHLEDLLTKEEKNKETSDKKENETSQVTGQLFYYNDVVFQKDCQFNTLKEYIFNNYLHIDESNQEKEENINKKLYFAKPFLWQLKDPSSNIPSLKWSHETDNVVVKYNQLNNSYLLLFYYSTPEEFNNLINSKQSDKINHVSESYNQEASFRLFTAGEQRLKKEQEEKEANDKIKLINERLKIMQLNQLKSVTGNNNDNNNNNNIEKHDDKSNTKFNQD